MNWKDTVLFLVIFVGGTLIFLFGMSIAWPWTPPPKPPEQIETVTFSYIPGFNELSVLKWKDQEKFFQVNGIQLDIISSGPIKIRANGDPIEEWFQ